MGISGLFPVRMVPDSVCGCRDFDEILCGESGIIYKHVSKQLGKDLWPDADSLNSNLEELGSMMKI